MLARRSAVLASDREHLLAVIEAGFGDFYDFNRVARKLFASRLRDEASPAPAPLVVNCVEI